MNENEMYGHAKDFRSSELSSLSQRTNFFLVTQSVLIGALAFAFQYTFPYLFPALLSLLVVAGIALASLTIFSGRESSQSMIRWRIYMKKIEGESENTPWNQYYKLYNQKHKDKNSIIDTSPLPYMWLCFPAIFIGIWFLVSLYVPIRLRFDNSFMIIGNENYRLYSTIVSLVSVTVACIGIVISIIQYNSWKKDTYELN